MATYAFLAIVLCAGVAQATFRARESSPTTIEEYPSLVQVDFRATATGIWSQSCSGSILNSRFCLSAANCFHGITYHPSNRRIRAGSSYRDTDGELAYVDVEFNYPTYGQNGHDADLSVVRLLDALVYSPVIAQSVISAQGTVFPGGVSVTHAGWGALVPGGAPSPVLRHTDIFTIDNQFCKASYEGLSIPEIITENMICVGFLGETENDACQGDFGGPIYYSDATYGKIVIGIVSWGYGCSNSSFPGVSTAVPSFSDWIVSVAV